MKATLLFFLTLHLGLFAQSGMYRQYPQPVPANWQIPLPHAPVRCADGGYILSALKYVMGFETTGGITGEYSIKTDSLFVPQWKRAALRAIPLPTGGIILVYQNAIEKVTASGQPIWRKKPDAVLLTAGIYYDGKIRVLGNTFGQVPIIGTAHVQWYSQGYSAVLDTTGNKLSENYFNTALVLPGPFYSRPGSVHFSGIKRDSSGNFFLFSPISSMVSVSHLVLAKFDSTFTFQWARCHASGNDNTMLADVEILSNGDIVGTGLSGSAKAALFKFNAQGQLLSHKVFPRRSRVSGLCSNGAGNYIFLQQTADSLFMLETDTALNVIWHKLVGRATALGGGLIRGNKIYVHSYNDSKSVLISTGLNGESCSSHNFPVTAISQSIAINSFTLNPIPISVNFTFSAVNSFSTQTYSDSCNCPVFINQLQNKLCLSDTGAITISGTGNLSWYGGTSGNLFLQSGPQFTFSSAVPTVTTVFAQDSACVNAPVKTAVSISVFPTPTISFSPLNPTICAGGQVFVTGTGANDFRWHSLSDSLSYIQNLNPTVSTVYTVTGSYAPGCSHTNTMQVTVVPQPTMTPSANNVCLGDSIVLNVNGVSTYTWYSYGWSGQGLGSSPLIMTPVQAGNSLYNLAGTIGHCLVYKQVTITALPSPTVNILTFPSLICTGEQSVLYGAGASSYSWSTGASQVSINVTPSVTTTYTLTGSTAGCKAQSVSTVTVLPKPVLVAAASATSACIGALVTISVAGASSYTWSNGINLSSQTLAALPGINTYLVFGEQNGCVVNSNVTIVGHPKPQLNTAGTMTAVCYGNIVQLTCSGALSYTWAGIGPVQTASLAVTGNTTMVVYGANGGCLDSAKVNIMSVSNPFVSVSTNKTHFCPGDSIQLTANGASTYSWSTGSTTPQVIEKAKQSKTYLVKGFNGFGCWDTAQVVIVVHLLPSVGLSGSDTVLCAGETLTLSAFGANTYTWDGGQPGNILVDNPQTTTSYTVTGEDANGCKDSATVQIIVDACTGLVGDWKQGHILFYPNPIEDLLVFELPSFYEGRDLEVYSVDGRLMLSSKISRAHGNLSITHLASGVYYLRISGIGFTGKITKL